MHSNTARALYYTGVHSAELREVALTSLGEAEPAVLVRSLYSGISRGTERLVFEGRVPKSEWQRMRAPFQDGDFPFPVKYGYAAVGVVEDGPPKLAGRAVFALHPHQDRFILPSEAVIPLPDRVPPRLAILAANMETALNALWDSGAESSEDVIVIGAGTVGCLIAYLAVRLLRANVTLIDRLPERAEVAAAMGARSALPEQAPAGARIVFHTSASEAGLRLALDSAGFEARIIEVSWFGDREISLPLGGAFHSRRLQLVSSQVGSIAPPHRARVSHRQRLTEAVALLDDPCLLALITDEVAFEDTPAAIPRILASDAPSLTAAIRYTRT